MPSGTDPHSQTEIAPLAPAESSSADGLARIAGRYDLLGMLGAGAMGTVYRARDTELDEVVALKVLKKELAAAQGMLERFKHEVKLARRVTHRNVARTFDIGEHGGDRFLTMEYVEGEMLGARLARLGRLPAREAIRFAVDVCRGLEAAHESGVLHRDLKPENVIVAKKDERAVITDFGIARAFTDGEARRTSGMLVGTPAYMAPEQVEGLADLDARTDLYALGVMLFELVSGVLPFQGESVLSIAAARLIRPAPDVRSMAPDVSTSLAGVIAKLLTRDRTGRYPDAREAAAALEAIATLETAPLVAPAPVLAGMARGAALADHAHKIAVLPLLNLGPADDLYLAQVLTEDLVDQLSMVPELRVRPRGETAAYQGAERDVREIGRALGVDVVVDGSVRRVGENVRASVRLVTVADGFQLWAKRFERPASDVLGVADIATAAMSRALTTRQVDTMRIAAVDARAQDLYLRGRFLLHRAWHVTSQEAIGLLREAHQRAPDDARIAGALALALARPFWMGALSPELVREARETADRALRLAPAQAEAHVARGLMHVMQGEISAALTELGIALSHAPNSVEALDALGRMLVELGRIDEGIAMLSRALAIEPDFASLRIHRARAQALLGRWDLAEADLDVVPDHAGDIAPWLLIKTRVMLLWRGRADLAPEIVAEVGRRDLPDYVRGAIAGMAGVAVRRAITADDRVVLEANLPVGKGVSPRRSSFNAQTAAELMLVCGEDEAAIERLEVADANGLFDIAWLDRVPLLDHLRGKHPGLARVRTSVALRAERALEALAAVER